MFTYQDKREDLKRYFLLNPFSCTYGWITNWINLEIAKLPKGSLVLEMGTFVGGTTQLLAKNNSHVTIHTIDLNNFNEDNHMLADMKISLNLPLLSAVDLLEIQKMHTEDFTNIVLHTGDSKSLTIDKFSIIFIDAGHKEEEVTEDLQYAWDHLVDGGYIFGDDANTPNVYNAFANFAKDKDVELTLYSKCARIQKTDRINPTSRFYAPVGHPVHNDILIVNEEINL
jgi:predicted O-methyltransferase YrrM